MVSKKATHTKTGREVKRKSKSLPSQLGLIAVARFLPFWAKIALGAIAIGAAGYSALPSKQSR